ncbi:MAG: DUF5615 family PIN-like protein [Anaerolineae bacterium]
MASLYADENFWFNVVKVLRSLDHDVLTAQEAGNAGLRIPDNAVLAYAAENERAVLTLNRRDFIRLHGQNQNHAGIIVCTEDRDTIRLAARIHQAIVDNEPLAGKLVRVIRPQV